jgi:hypothetical protein
MGFGAHDDKLGPRLRAQVGLGPPGIGRRVGRPWMAGDTLAAPLDEPSPGFGLTTPGEVGQGKAAGASPIASGGEPTKAPTGRKERGGPSSVPPPGVKLSEKGDEWKPWIAAGVSRATWFRQAKKRASK